jgi:carboxyl-terminal processing protease
MRTALSLLFVCLSGWISLAAQPLPKAAKDAFLISRMANKYHFQPRPLDDALSNNLFTDLLETLDEQKIFFTREDMDRLAPWRLKLDDEIRTRQTGFLQLLTATYRQRLMQADTMIDNICKVPFNFQLKEKFTTVEDTTWPATTAAMRTKLYKLLKSSVLDAIIDYAAITGSTKAPSKKYVDSLEPMLRKKANVSFKRSIKRILKTTPAGIEESIGNLYCQTLATCYDPHTAYFPSETKEDFEGHLGKKQPEFGLAINEDKDGNTQISSLKPGSLAFQSGQLNEGDKIQQIQVESKPPVDVSVAQPDEISKVLSTAGTGKTVITVKKADGSTKQVTLNKQKPSIDDEEEKVKSFLLKGSKTVGYISLPAFYTDWEEKTGVNGCANDVGKEIIKLKKENISGLILDLRYNGGGSMEEALELAGIFIDAGPVGQVKTREGKIATLKDINRGTVYDGPLLLLINGFSASASELLAGTLQDYNRALIAGSPSYGKATAQVILPLDTTINLETYAGEAKADSYIKITTSALYRLTGSTAQAAGVVPDVVLPDMADGLSQRETDEKNVLKPVPIAANKYYKSLAPLPVAAAVSMAAAEMQSSAYFKEVQQYTEQIKADQQEKDISLFIDDAWQESRQAEHKAMPAAPISGKVENPVFTITNHAYAQQRLQADSGLKEVNDDWIQNLLADPYIKIAYQLLAGTK